MCYDEVEAWAVAAPASERTRCTPPCCWHMVIGFFGSHTGAELHDVARLIVGLHGDPAHCAHLASAARSVLRAAFTLTAERTALSAAIAPQPRPAALVRTVTTIHP